MAWLAVGLFVVMALGIGLVAFAAGANCSGSEACEDFTDAVQLVGITVATVACTLAVVAASCATARSAAQRRAQAVAQRSQARLTTVKKAFAEGGVPVADFDEFAGRARLLEDGTHDALSARSAAGTFVAAAIGAASMAPVVALVGTMLGYGLAIDGFQGDIATATAAACLPVVAVLLFMLGTLAVAGLTGGLVQRRAATHGVAAELAWLDAEEDRLLRIAHETNRPAQRPRRAPRKVAA